MNPILIDKYVALNAYDELLENVKWTNAGAPRMECFMSETPKQYGYDTKDGLRFYESIPYYSLVLSIQNKLNNKTNDDIFIKLKEINNKTSMIDFKIKSNNK